MISMEEIAKRSKFIDVKNNLDFFSALPIDNSNAKQVIELFNECFVNPDKYEKQYSGSYATVYPEKILPNPPKQYVEAVKDIEELGLGLEEIGFSIQRLSFYESGDKIAKNFFIITGFRESEIYFDLRSIDDFLKGMNRIIDLSGDYEIKTSEKIIKEQLNCLNPYSEMSLIKIALDGGFRVEVKIQNSVFSITDITSKASKNIELTNLIKELEPLSKRLNNHIITDLTIGNIAVYYNSETGQFDSSQTIPTHLIKHIHKILAISNLVARILHINPDFSVE